MKVFELHYPGVSLKGAPEQQLKAWTLLPLLEMQLADAGMGLALFEKARAGMPKPDQVQRRARIRRITQEIEAELPSDLDPRERWRETHKIQESAELQARREEWAAGYVPETYARRLPFMHAHTVVYALDEIDKLLEILAKMGLPSEVADALNAYRTVLPYLRDVRDTSHHIEDRARGLDRRGRPLVLQPISNPLINAPDGAVALDNLNGNKLGYTTSDGNYREVEISVTSVAAAQTAIQCVLNALTWSGPARIMPN